MGGAVIARGAAGAAAGLAGTLGLLALQTASERWLPETMPSYAEDPGEFMVRKAEARLPRRTRKRIPAPIHTAAAQALAAGYGIAAGAVFAAVRGTPAGVFRDGVVLGLATWVAGYAGWLPALGLLPPLRDQPRGEVVGPAGRHVLFGILTVAVYRGLGGRAAGKAARDRGAQA